MTTSKPTGIRFISIPGKHAKQLRSGGTDANDQKPEIMISDGSGFPCRHCLKEIKDKDEVMVLAYRPFEEKQPYAEVGPIFIHGKNCEQHKDNGEIPDNILSQGITLIRGYSADNKIVYGSGKTVQSKNIKQEAEKMFTAPKIAYIHARSSTNNCFTCRIVRA